jgi:hypothetical protein
MSRPFNWCRCTRPSTPNYTYGHVDQLPAGGFLVALRDTHGAGHADVVKRFGDGLAQGSAGGTGIALYNRLAAVLFRRPVPPGATRDQVSLGSRIFWGEATGGTCSAATIDKGVAAPKHADGAMPPRGGAPLSDSDVKAVAAFVWGISH